MLQKNFLNISNSCFIFRNFNKFIPSQLSTNKFIFMKKATRAIQGLFLFVVGVSVISCNQGKHVTEPTEITGEWKTIQMKPTPKQPLRDFGKCDGDTTKWRGDIYTFKEDGTFSTKDICFGKTSKNTKCRWKYEDNILVLTYVHKDLEVKTVYSVADMGDGKIKFLHIFTRWGAEVFDYPTSTYVLKKQ